MGAMCTTPETGRAAFASVPYRNEAAPHPQIPYKTGKQQQPLATLIQTPSTLPLSELTTDGIVCLRGLYGQFNTEPVPNAAWLRGVMSEAEWEADVTSVTAAAAAPATRAYASSTSPSLKHPLHSVLADGQEFISFERVGGNEGHGLVVIKRIFLWWEDDVDMSTPALYWNDSGPSQVVTGQMRVRNEQALRPGRYNVYQPHDYCSPPRQGFPNGCCFDLCDSTGMPRLFLAAESLQASVVWRVAFRRAVTTRDARKAERQPQLVDPAAVMSKQIAAATLRVQQLNARYEHAGRGEQVKWLFQPMMTQTGGMRDACQLQLHCRQMAAPAAAGSGQEQAEANALQDEPPPPYESVAALPTSASADTMVDIGVVKQYT